MHMLPEMIYRRDAGKSFAHQLCNIAGLQHLHWAVHAMHRGIALRQDMCVATLFVCHNMQIKACFDIGLMTVQDILAASVSQHTAAV